MNLAVCWISLSHILREFSTAVEPDGSKFVVVGVGVGVRVDVARVADRTCGESNSGDRGSRGITAGTGTGFGGGFGRDNGRR